MVIIKVDEGYAFDFLSIIEVKKIKKLHKADQQYEFYSKSIKNQLDEKLFDKIIKSSDYNLLLKSNTIIYDTLEEIRLDNSKIPAKVIDNLNTDRYSAKILLQKKFFNVNIMELKS